MTRPRKPISDTHRINWLDQEQYYLAFDRLNLVWKCGSPYDILEKMPIGTTIRKAIDAAIKAERMRKAA